MLIDLEPDEIKALLITIDLSGCPLKRCDRAIDLTEAQLWLVVRMSRAEAKLRAARDLTAALRD